MQNLQKLDRPLHMRSGTLRRPCSGHRPPATWHNATNNLTSSGYQERLDEEEWPEHPGYSRDSREHNVCAVGGAWSEV